MTTAVLETSSQLGIPADEQSTGLVPDSDWAAPQEDLRPQPHFIPGTTSRIKNEQRTAAPLPPSIEPARNRVPRITIPNRTLKLNQQWECVISAVRDEVVECEMHDLLDPRQPVEVAEIYIAKFEEFDRPLLEEGAVFYWSIGVHWQDSGQIRKYSRLRLRRMPQLSASQLSDITTKANEIFSLFEAH